MDIFNINIHQITRQYLEYIKAMRRLDLEVAGEFVAMAATLLHIKSRLLLPQYTEEGEEAPEDPRQGLVQKLLEYKKFQELSGELYRLPILGRDVFARGERADIESLEEGELILEEKPLFALIASYRTAVKNMKKTVHKVLGELQSIAARILEMKDLLVIGRRIVFREFITEKEKPANQVLVTFLSLLELAKMGFVSLFQSETFADIYVEAKKTIDRDVVSQVESYESVHAEQKADEIMVEAQLSLTESTGDIDEETPIGFDVMGDGEEKPEAPGLVQAATDEEIEAEERLLFGGDEPVVEAAVEAVESVVEVVPEPIVEPVVEPVKPELDHLNVSLFLTAPDEPTTPEEPLTDEKPDPSGEVQV